MIPLANKTMRLGVRVYNTAIRWFRPRVSEALDPDILAIRAKATIGTDISSHLEALFLEGLRACPRLIVELGVRGGESTFVLERVARRCSATLVSADIDDCSTVCQYEKWHFVKGDDVAFGQRFSAWCSKHGLPIQIDLLFIDTSHLYDHTVAEIHAWFPHLRESAVVIFHDTNLKKWYRRRDWTIGSGWDNSRGVIRAVEDFLGVQFDERHPFQRKVDCWHVTHDPVCNGLTVLRRSTRPF
jgi:cephalosporin hydroxylase